MQTGSINATAALLLLVALAAQDPSGALADWRICDEGEFAVTGGDVEPFPAHSGDEVVFHINATATTDITGGTLEVHVDYLGFHVYSSEGDLCKAVPCPLAAGPQVLTFRQKLPSIAPPGAYLGSFQARDQGGTVLFCVDIPFRIALRSTTGQDVDRRKTDGAGCDLENQLAAS